MKGNLLPLLLIGPTIVVLLAAILATIALVAGATGRLDRLTALGAEGVERLSHGRALLLFWGLAAFLLTLLVAAILVNSKVLALLGLVVLLFGLTLAGFGLCVSAARCGRRLASALGHSGGTPLLRLSLGLAAFFLAAFLPFVGWLVVFLAVLTGIGATLDTLLRRHTL